MWANSFKPSTKDSGTGKGDWPKAKWYTSTPLL
jgi:hypothetical protein